MSAFEARRSSLPSAALCVLSVAATIAGAGCSGPMRHGRPAFERGDYEDAVVHLSRAATAAPDDLEARSLLETATERAVKRRYELAREALDRLRFADALALIQGAQELSPGAAGEPSIEQVALRRASIETEYQRAVELASASRWRDALAAYDALGKFRTCLPELDAMRDDARRSLARELCDEAAALRERGELAAADVRLREAATLEPGEPKLHATTVRIEEDRHLESLSLDFTRMFDARDFLGARRVAGAALALRPGDADWTARLAAADEAWAAVLYNAASEGILADTEAGLRSAIDALEKAETLRPGFRDAARRIEDAMGSLARLHETKARALPGPERAGQRLVLLWAASRLVPNSSGLARSLDETKKQLKARRQCFISVSAEDLPGREGDGYAPSIAHATRAAIESARIPDLNIVHREGMQAKAEEQVYAQLFGGQFELDVKPATVAVALRVVEKSSNKLGYDKPIARTSEYKAGTVLRPNPAYAKAVNYVEQSRRDSEEKRRRRSDSALRYEEQEKIVESQTQYDWLAQNKLNELRWNFSQASSELDAAEEQLRADENALASTPREVEEVVIRKYTYHAYDVRAEASVKVVFEIVDNQTTLFKTTDAVEVSVAHSDRFTRGVKAEDTAGLVENRDELRDPRELLEEAKSAASEKLSRAVVAAFRSYARKHIQSAREALRLGSRAEALERSVDFLYATTGRAGPEADEADRIVQDVSGFSFRVPASKVLPIAATTPELGVEIRARASGLGLDVLGVRADSPAARGGLQTGDVIFAIDLEALERTESLVNDVRSRALGTSVFVQLWRNGTIHWVPLVLDVPARGN